MGRLFWKFFVFIWLAQVAGIIAIGSIFWFMNPRPERESNADRPSATAGDPRADAGHGSDPYASSERGLPRGRPPERGGPASTWPRPPPNRLPPRGGPPPIATIATLLASVATALGLAWYVAQPVRRLRRAFDAVAAGDLEVRIAPSMGTRHDELADLGRDFDRMADRLQVSMNGQRRLLHDVSHEMRSPLARLQAAVGLIRLKYGQEPVIERIEEEIVRIDGLVADLLKLSRLEVGELGEALEEVDVLEMVRAVVDDANFEARALGRSVLLEREAEGRVAGRPQMLHGALENVVRNALKHATGSREIRIDTAADPALARYMLWVRDSGPGVPENELARLFTPFFRAVQSARTEGHGLGLAIARRSIETHGGTITASNRPDGGLVVEITLPLRSETRS